METRRVFLKQTLAALSAGLLVGCGASSSTAASSAAASSTAASSTAASSAAPAQALDLSTIEAPSYPFEYHELDIDTVQTRAFNSFYDKNGCARAVFDSIIGELADEYGYPYNQVPTEMYSNGHSGYTIGSLCGSLGGAAGALGLLVPPEEVDDLLKELESWYSVTEFPIYQPEMELVTTVANSVNCADSLGTWMKAADVAERSDPKRKARCAGLSADVAGKVVELLNIHYGFAEAEAPAESVAASNADNQYTASAKGMEGDVTVRVTVDDGKISAVEVLSHNETAGIGTNAIDQLPEKFVGLSSDAEIDAVDGVSGATITSNALKEAVKSALNAAK